MGEALTQLVALVAVLLGAGGLAALVTARSQARRADVDALCQAMATMQTRLDKVMARLELTEGRLADSESERSELRLRLEAVESERTELITATERQAVRIVELESEVASLKRRLRRYEESGSRPNGETQDG